MEENLRTLLTEDFGDTLVRYVGTIFGEDEPGDPTTCLGKKMYDIITDMLPDAADIPVVEHPDVSGLGRRAPGLYMQSGDIWNCGSMGERECVFEDVGTSLQDITGRESGGIVYDPSSNDVLIVNWSSVDGVPRLSPFGDGVIGLGRIDVVRVVDPPEDIVAAMKQHELDEGAESTSDDDWHGWEIETDTGETLLVVTNDNWN